MTLAEFQGESLGYGRGVVLEDVTLRLSVGERVVLLGRSGAGKTTLLNALYDRMTASGVRVALAPQDHALVPQLSVLRNALMGRLDDHGWAYNLLTLIRPRRTERAAIADVLAQVGLGDQIDRAVGTLSGGQKQRTALARALYRNGQVLIADEPVSAVDETHAAALLQLMRDSVSTSVLALHDVGLARAFATRLIGIRTGRIVLDAPPDQITPEQIAALYAV